MVFEPVHFSLFSKLLQEERPSSAASLTMSWFCCRCCYWSEVFAVSGRSGFRYCNLNLIRERTHEHAITVFQCEVQSITMLGMKLQISHRNIYAKLILPLVFIRFLSNSFFPQTLEENICSSTLTPSLPSHGAHFASADKFCSALKRSNFWTGFF